jgi:hypothetical protein
VNRLDNALVFAVSTLGVTPHAGQADYLLDQHAVKVLVGGRRAGKTFALAVEIIFRMVLAIAARRALRQLIVAPGVDQAKLLLATVGRLLAASPLGGLVESEVASPFPELRLAHGGLIFVRAAAERGRLLRGHSADRVIVDEAAYLPDEVITEAILPTLADTGGQLVLASTPTSRGSLFHRLFEQGQAPDPRVRSFRLQSAENPHIDQGFVAAQRAGVTARQWATEYEGAFAETEGSLFRWDHVVACADATEGPPEPGASYAIGWDPAARRDASAVVVVDLTARPPRVVHVEDVRGGDYVGQVSRVASLARLYHGARVVIDATGHGAVLADMLRREGTWTKAFTFTARSKASLLTRLAVLLEHRRLRIPSNRRDLLDEMRNYEITTSATGSQTFGVPERAGHDDLVTALALAVEGLTTDGTLAREPDLPPFLPPLGRLPVGSALMGSDGLPDEWISWGRAF